MFVSSFHKLHSFQFTDWWTFPSTLCSHFLHLNIFTLGCVFSDWKPKKYGPKEISGPRPFSSSFLMLFWLFYSFFSFCINFWGRGAAAVRLLLRSPPLHQLSHSFPEFPEFSPIYLQSPRFQCFIATMQLSSIWSSTFPKKSETFFAQIGTNLKLPSFYMRSIENLGFA